MSEEALTNAAPVWSRTSVYRGLVVSEAIKRELPNHRAPRVWFVLIFFEVSNFNNQNTHMYYVSFMEKTRWTLLELSNKAFSISKTAYCYVSSLAIILSRLSPSWLAPSWTGYRGSKSRGLCASFHGIGRKNSMSVCNVFCLVWYSKAWLTTEFQ